MRSSTFSPPLSFRRDGHHMCDILPRHYFFPPSGGLKIGAQISNESHADLWHQNNLGQGSFEHCIGVAVVRYFGDNNEMEDLLSSFPASSIGFHPIGRRGVFLIYCLFLFCFSFRAVLSDKYLEPQGTAASIKPPFRDR